MQWDHKLFEVGFEHYTANVYRELQGLYREIGVQEFQIYRDCMYTLNPYNFGISTLFISIVIFAENLIYMDSMGIPCISSREIMY